MKKRDALSPSALVAETFGLRKRANPRYSIRAFARDLGLSHTALGRLLRGELELSPTTAKKILGRLGLEPKTISRALHALRLRHEKDSEVRRLLESNAPERKTAAVRPIVRLAPEAFGENGVFRAVLILAYLARMPAKAEIDPVEVSERARIDLADVREVLRTLEAAGFLARRSDGGYAKLGKRWEFQATKHSLPLKNVHRQALKLVDRRLVEISPTDRYSVTEVLSLPAAKLGELQAKCEEFVDAIRALSDSGSDEKDGIFLVSLHAVPWISR